MAVLEAAQAAVEPGAVLASPRGHRPRLEAPRRGRRRPNPREPLRRPEAVDRHWLKI